MSSNTRATRAVTRSQSRADSRASSVAAPLPSIEEDIMAPRARANATPSSARPSIPVATSTGYGSAGKLGSPSRRLRASNATGGDIAADVGSRLARLSEEGSGGEETGSPADEPVAVKEPVVPVWRKKKEEKVKRGKNHVIGNESFGVEGVVGRSAAVETVAPTRNNAARSREMFELGVECIDRSGHVPAESSWSSGRLILTFLALWLLCVPLLSGLLAVTRDVPWLETAKSVATFGLVPPPRPFEPSYSVESASIRDLRDLHTKVATISSSLRQDIGNDIKDIRSDMTRLHSDVNGLSSKIPTKGSTTASTYFSGNGIPAHIVPSHDAPRVNHFSINLGAVIDPYLTSPDRTEAIPYENPFLRWLYPDGEAVKKTYSPNEALSPWEDLGDCWCAPSAVSFKGRAQIGVILSQPIIPTDLVIEHIEGDRTLDSDSTPKDFELLVQIPDAAVREKVVRAAKLWLREDDAQTTPQKESARWAAERKLDETWVKVGRWRYDLHAAHNVQIFRIPGWLGDAGRFGDDAGATSFGISKVVVRTRTNWGDAPYTCFYRLKLFGHLVQDVVDGKVRRGNGRGRTVERF